MAYRAPPARCCDEEAASWDRLYDHVLTKHTHHHVAGPKLQAYNLGMASNGEKYLMMTEAVRRHPVPWVCKGHCQRLVA